jgi:hypothetical protein
VAVMLAFATSTLLPKASCACGISVVDMPCSQLRHREELSMWPAMTALDRSTPAHKARLVSGKTQLTGRTAVAPRAGAWCCL